VAGVRAREVFGYFQAVEGKIRLQFAGRPVPVFGGSLTCHATTTERRHGLAIRVEDGVAAFAEGEEFLPGRYLPQPGCGFVMPRRQRLAVAAQRGEPAIE